ncbi:MAG: proton-conducting transporter membrane subunit [Halolamina sp.]
MSTSHLAVSPLLIALLTAVATLLTGPTPRLQGGLSVLGSVGYLGAVLLLANRVFAGETLVYQVSNWQAPFGIVAVADPLSTFMLVLTGVVSLPALVYAVDFMDEFSQRLSFHTLWHFMLAGVSGAFLTGDIFNLFVWFEVMLMSSYVLVLFYSGARHTRAALSYVVLNLLGSAVMLLAIGGIYATTGTLNMADMARLLAAPDSGVAAVPTLGLGALLFSVFALKAGIVPFHFWVPAAYRAAPAPVTAMLAGVVKKVGVYAIVRLYFTVFAAAEVGGFALPGLVPAGDGAFLGFFGPIFFVLGAASILLGGVGAVGREDIDGMLAFSSIGQVGFILLPLGVAATVPSLRVLGVTAALLYSFNHGLAKALLYLVSGTITDAVGSDRFETLGGVAGQAPLVAAPFFVGILALIGIPPLPGFFGKFFVFRTAAEAWALGAPGASLAVGVALAGAVLTIAYFSRVWNEVFWGAAPAAVLAGFGGRLLETDGGDRAEEADDSEIPPAINEAAAPVQAGVLVSLALALVVTGVGFEFVLSAAEAAAEAALDTAGYIEAVSPATNAGESGSAHSLLLLVAGPALSRGCRLLAAPRAAVARWWER